MEQKRLMGMLRRLNAKSVPVKVRFECTKRCNLRCVHCKIAIRKAPSDELSPAEMADIFAQLKKAGTFQLAVTGGEVFARPDATEVLETVFAQDFLVAIQTNGTLVGPEHIALMKRNNDKLVRCAVSLYGGDAATHEAVTRVAGSFDAAVRTLSLLKEAGVSTAVFCMLMKENAPHFRKAEEFFKQLGVHYQFSTLMVAREDGCADPLGHAVDDETLRSLPIKWDEFLNPDPLSVPSAYPPETMISEWCVAGRMANILPNGDMAPCSVIKTPAGNLRESSFQELYDSPLFNQLRALRVGDMECRDCEYFPRCKPCPGISFNESGRYTARTRAYCKLTKTFINLPGRLT